MLSVVLALFVSAPTTSGREGWRGDELHVREEHVRDFKQLQSIALSYLGQPYVRAGSGAPGFDCSGFSCRVFAESGFAIPRTSKEQSRVGKPVRFDALMPGDLLFFAGRGRRVDHVGIYLGSGQMIHAASGEGRVIVSNVHDRWYRKRFVGARRIFGVLGPTLEPSSGPQIAAVDESPASSLSFGHAFERAPRILVAGELTSSFVTRPPISEPFGALGGVRSPSLVHEPRALGSFDEALGLGTPRDLAPPASL
ncbi:MAG: C40 family peptidase [Deltaproteobacteria bacterium]|nr:C40 family peptidase [Deltaproteobacteria bacterium]